MAISEALQIPLVFHLRGGAEMMSDKELRGHAFQLPYLLWRKRLWERASAILCVSRFIHRKAVEAGFPREKLRVHYTGIDFSRFTPEASADRRDRNLVLYVGRVVPYKGADHLVRAMQVVRRDNPSARLAVIGDGPFLPTVRGLAHELEVPCDFLGEQPAATIRELLQKARVFCGPSMTQPDGMSEAFGNVFTEAQAMGVPIVSYRHGGIPETMIEGETGLLAEEGDHKELAVHLKKYLTDDSFWMRSRDIGMKWVRENFDIFKQTAKLENLYEEIIFQSGRPHVGIQHNN